MNTPLQTLLIVEDDAGLQSQLRWSLEDYHVIQASDRAGALAQLRAYRPAVILQDLGLPPDPAGTEEGFATIAEILRQAPHAKVIVVTGNGDRNNAVKAIGQGAYDFCAKPLDLDVLRLIVSRAFRVHELEEENRKFHALSASPLEGIVGASPAILNICRLVEKVSTSNASVLLLGETGTGKELFAKALHRLSARHDGPFIAINCAAIPETLLEAELFGYEKGAYTGATKLTQGKIELADRGTLLLDEIGDMPLVLQTKLLRFLEERVVERVGGRKRIAVDVRVICATHQDLAAQIHEARFRQDLYYRVSEVVIQIPPLRERHGDAVLLARYFLAHAIRRHARAIRGFTSEALRAIETHSWKGNVRELENAVNSAVIMADGNMIGTEELNLAPAEAAAARSLREQRADAEQRAIEQALAQTQDNLSRAAKLLGITRPTLYDLMNKYGFSRTAERKLTTDSKD